MTETRTAYTVPGQPDPVYVVTLTEELMSTVELFITDAMAYQIQHAWEHAAWSLTVAILLFRRARTLQRMAA